MEFIFNLSEQYLFEKLLFIGQLIFWVFCYFFLFFFESTVRRGCRAGSIIDIVKYVNSEFESYCFL